MSAANPKFPKSGYRFCFSIAALMRRLSFDITDAESVRRACDLYKPVINPPLPVLAANASQLEREYDYRVRRQMASKMARANSDTASPIVSCIASVLQNRYLEQPPESDTVQVEFMRFLEGKFARNPDTGTYPWQELVTSMPVRDYCFRSADTERYASGRLVSMYDVLQMLYLKRNDLNDTPVHRNNYTRANIYTAMFY